MQGLITKSTGSWYSVLSADGHRTECRIKGIFRTKGITTTNPLAVGDVVDFEMEPDQESKKRIPGFVGGSRGGRLKKSMDHGLWSMDLFNSINRI